MVAVEDLLGAITGWGYFDGGYPPPSVGIGRYLSPGGDSELHKATCWLRLTFHDHH